MDIVNSFFELLNNEKIDAFIPVIELLKENSFDLKKTVANITPEQIFPIIELFINNSENDAKENENNGLKPVVNIANNEIFNSLNNFFSR